MNTLEKNTTIALAEAAVLSDGRKIAVQQQIMLLSSGLRTAQLEALKEALNSLRVQHKMILNWTFTDHSFEIELSDNFPIPEVSVVEKEKIFNLRLRRILLFRLYEEYTKVNHRFVHFSLATMAEPLGVSSKDIYRHVEYLDSQHFLAYGVMDGGLCTSDLTDYGIELCENPGSAFEQFSAITMQIKQKAEPAPQQTSQIKILFFAANPKGMTPLQLDEEIRTITQKIRASKYRDTLNLCSMWAVRSDDLLQYLNEHKPQVVHFSGHGSRSGEICLVDANGNPKSVSANAIRALFTTLKDNIRLVVLNACYSKIQAQAIVEVIDCVVGMNTAIGDRAAIIFAASFYRAIGFGRSIQEAFDQGITALLLEGIPEENTPELMTREGVDPGNVYLVIPSE